MLETFTLAHETAANTNATTACNTHDQGVRRGAAHTETEAKPEPKPETRPTQLTQPSPKRSDRTVNTQCSDALRQQLDLHNTAAIATPADWSDELEACIADACRCVGKQALAKHPKLADNAEPSAQQRCAAAQEIAACMIQQVETLTSDGIIANVPETGSSEAKVLWLITRLTQNTEACLTNEL